MIGDQMREHSAVHLSDQDLTLLLDGELAAARERALAAGCDDYDTKPVEITRLLDKIRALIDKPVV